jgi:hypothetical protein
MNATYRAIALSGPGQFSEVNKPLLDPGPGQVRIRVEACGVCHSDSGTVEALFPIDWPRVPGHEVVGRIDALGPGVRGWAPGQRVGVGFLAGSCGYCEFCRNGDLVNCRNQEYTGIHHDGGYAAHDPLQRSGRAELPHPAPKPLAGYVFSRDQEAIDRVLQSLSFGGGAVNQTNIFLFIESMPYGGVGTSGIGNYYGKYGYDSLTHAKSVLISPPDVAIDHLFPPYTQEKVQALNQSFDYWTTPAALGLGSPKLKFARSSTVTRQCYLKARMPSRKKRRNMRTAAAGAVRID